MRDACREISATRGRMPNILKIHSLHPQAMTEHWAFYRGLMLWLAGWGVMPMAVLG